MIHILIVDDDDRLRELLKRYLMQQGFIVCCAETLAEAKIALCLFQIHVVLLDIMLPEQKGWDLFQEKADLPPLPAVIFMSALGQPQDRTKGLALGAQDYIVKPFDPEELIFRIQKILKHMPGRLLTFGKLTFHPQKGLLKQGQDPISLTEQETKLLTYFSQRLYQVISRQELAQHVFPQASNIRVVDVQISRLRKKLEQDPTNPQFLISSRSQGYILKE